MDATPWTRRYMPRFAAEVIGQQEAVNKLRRFIDSFGRGKKRAALLYGLTGCGKTAAVYAVAREMQYEVLEINASDSRNAASINDIIGSALGQMSLFSKGKIILVDEMDGVSGKDDRGGVQALTGLIETAAFPVVMTANEPWDKKFGTLRKASEMIEFLPIDVNDAFSVLKRISNLEKIEADDGALRLIASRSGGDLRAAVNDLQVLSTATKKLTIADAELLSDRNRVESIMSALAKIFKTLDFQTAITALDEVEEQQEDWFLWLDENLPAEYKNPRYLAKAYEAMSTADVFSGRIIKNQYWRMLVYIKMILSGGVALAKDEKTAGAATYQRSGRLLKIWIANSRFNKRKNIAAKIAAATHTSPKKVINETLPYLKVAIRNSSYADKLIDELNLDEEEVEWLKR